MDESNHHTSPVQTSTSKQLEELRNDFLADLPQRIDAVAVSISGLDDSLQQRDISLVLSHLEELHQRLHKLIGSSGTFGVARVSAKAREMSEVINETFRDSSWPSNERIHRLRTLTRELQQSQFAAAERGIVLADPELNSLRLPRATCTAHVVDDDPIQVEQIRHFLEHQGYQVDTFSSVMIYADVYASLEQPDIIFMDMRFDGAQYAGAEVIRNLKQQMNSLPPVVFISTMSDIQSRLAALRAGATRYLTKPLDSGQLVRIADELTLRIPASPYRVMLVDDDAEVLAAHSLVLNKAGMNVLTVNRPMETLNQLASFQPEVLILDLMMPDVNGVELATLIREEEANEALPILFLSAETDPWRRLMTIGLGGDEFLPKPVTTEYLITTVTARARRARRLRQLLQAG